MGAIEPAHNPLADEIKSHGWWYHDLELGHGVWTGGQGSHSVQATRDLLGRVSVENMAVLDIGAMDGLFAVLVARRGARRICATDRYDRADRIALVRRTLGVDLDYAPNLSLDQIGPALQSLWGELPDLTLFSGVLYHMFDPMGGLARLRALVKKNGLVIIETVALASDAANLVYNDKFWMYGPGTYFVPTTGWLNSVLPFLGFEPIDCRYFEIGSWNGDPACRIALCCRAMDVPILTAPPPEYATGTNAWFVDYAKLDFCEFIDPDAVAGAAESTIGHSATSAFTPGPDCLKVQSFFGRSELQVDASTFRLRLDDKF